MAPTGVAPGPTNLTASKSSNDPRELEREPPFTQDELNKFAEKLGHGQVGWLRLDEEGRPTGEVLDEPPKDNQEFYAKVVGVKPVHDPIVTPAGAPITKQMNPDPQLWDDGMLARNPQPEQSDEERRKEKGPGAHPMVTGGNPAADTAHPKPKESPKK